MKLQMIKQPGGLLSPALEHELEYLNKLKNGGQYEIEIKKTRNPQYHRRAFKFFEFCFEFWASDLVFQDQKGQFDLFRKNLIVLAGFYDEFWKIDGTVRIEAKSISFANMDELEFRQCYNAMIQASIKHIFKTDDRQVFEKLMSFFD